MSVTFDEEQQITRTPISTSASGLYALVIRWGFAKDEKQANIVLFIAAASLILLAFGVWLLAPGGDRITTEEYLNKGNITVPPAP